MSKTPQIINIVNFVRGCEPRCEVDLVEPVEQQLRLLKRHGFRGTFLFQYDALISPDFAGVIHDIRLAGHEAGVWLEIVEPLAEDSGIPWRGRFPWDWHADVGFSVGYTLKQREALIDTLFSEFKRVFGAFPRVMGSWIIDAYTLKYAAGAYGLDASCNCKDQWGTDGYTLWGAYYNQAYYPSVNNVFCPAQGEETQINVPVFRMLGSDPVYQYDVGLDLDGEEVQRQGVVTLEPVYCEGGGGANRKWVDWYLRENFNGKCLSFGYTQAGQENSFGWESMKDGLEYQIEKFSQLVKSGAVTVEALGESGKKYKEKYRLTPPSTVTAESDWLESGKKSVWYSSKGYRINLFSDGQGFFIRDLHVFNDSYRERYLDGVCTDSVLKFDNLPVVDSSRFSGSGIRAGVFFCKNGAELRFKELRYTERDCKTAAVAFTDTECGCITFILSENYIRITAENPEGFTLKFRYCEKPLLPKAIEKRRDSLTLCHNGFSYTVRLKRAGFSYDTGEVVPENGVVEAYFS